MAAKPKKKRLEIRRLAEEPKKVKKVFPGEDECISVPYTLSACQPLRSGVARVIPRPRASRQVLCTTQAAPAPSSQFDHLHFNNETGFDLDQIRLRLIRADGLRVGECSLDAVPGTGVIPKDFADTVDVNLPVKAIGFELEFFAPAIGKHAGFQLIFDPRQGLEVWIITLHLVPTFDPVVEQFNLSGVAWLLVVTGPNEYGICPVPF